MPKGVYIRTKEYRKRTAEIQRGKVYSKESRKKMSIAQTGKKLLEETKKKIGIKISIINKGKHLSSKTEFKKGHIVKKETREKISKTLIGTRIGDKSTSWKGGITPEYQKIRGSIEYRLWREAVFARDNYTCQKYNTKSSGDLNAHHIHNFADYPELRTAIDNGITLSEKAHKEFHKKYGIKNNTREQLEEFLKD